MTHPTPPPARRAYRVRVLLALYLLGEAAALFAVGSAIGVMYTILLMLATSVLGAISMRVTGVKALRQYREAVRSARPAGPSVISGAIGVVGGLLLFLPGFVSDAAGLLCVFAPTRVLLRPLVTRFLGRRIGSPSFNRWFGPNVVRTQWGAPKAGKTAGDDDVIEGEVVDGESGPSGGTGHGHENGPRSLS
jgi:UPF0716 protein FxsA